MVAVVVCVTLLKLWWYWLSLSSCCVSVYTQETCTPTHGNLCLSLWTAATAQPFRSVWSTDDDGEEEDSSDYISN